MILEDNLHIGLSMHHENLLEGGGIHRLEPVCGLLIVGMRAERVNLRNARAHREPFSVNLDLEFAVLKTAAERVFRHESDEENLIGRVFYRVDEMVLDATCFAHAVCADDDHRSLHVIERLRFLDARDEFERVETEGVFMVLDKRVVRILVVTFGVDLENTRGVDGHRRVDVNRDFGNDFFVDERVEIVYEFLRAFDRERGYYDLAVHLDRIERDFSEHLECVVRAFVKAVAVCAFEQHVIDGRENGRIADDRFPFSAEVSGARDLRFFALAVGNSQDGHRRAENVPGIEELELYAGIDPCRTVIGNGHELIGRVDHVRFGEKGFPVECLAPMLRAPREILCVMSLYSRRIHHNDVREIPGCRRRVDVSFKSVDAQHR